jgi:DNA-directed DNA polymerase III PolC
VAFFEAARRFGVHPILGALVGEGQEEAALLVKNAQGYANLCRILSARDLDEGFSLGQVLRWHNEGLILLGRDADFIEGMRDAFEGRVYLALSGGGPRRKKTDLPIVAAPDVLFARSGDFEVHRLLAAFRLGKTLAGVGPSDCGRPYDFLRPPKEMKRRFSEAPQALKNTLRIAEQCSFDLLNRDVAFPRIAGRAGPGLLREHALEGARQRYGAVTSEVEARLSRELDTIIFMGFADYFLVVEDIVRHARKLGTPTAGRGSGAGSLVAYVLGITNVDPLKYDLPFERFLNAGRKDYPDLDVDFCWRLRDDVIDYAYERFGRDKVAMIATYATFRPRMALREVGKALGLSNPVITRIGRKLRQGISKDQYDTLPADPGVVERALALAQRLDGFPHHLSVHCGGVVITPGPIAEYAPLLRAEKGVVITAYDKDGVERAGLVKLDLLGNRSLSTVSETVKWIEQREGKRIDPERLPEDSTRTFDMIRAGRTVGCGQLESPAMRHLLRQMQPDRILHIMQALALIRPGAAGEGMKETFIRRKRGAEPVPALPPAFEKVLGEAYGVMLYEDDAMRIAMEAAGFAPGKADRFRKAVTKGAPLSDGKDPLFGGSLESLIEEFFQGCERQGMKRGEARAFLKMMAKFRSYSFCRAHAASYGELAYSAAWLKVHHPLEYWTAALNNNEGMYPKWVLVEEAKRSGAKMLRPCANRSEREFALQGDAIRAGLSCIASLSMRTREKILRLRPFISLEDLVGRAAPKEAEVEMLIRCGAMDFTGLPRNQLMWKAMTSFKEMRKYAACVQEGGLGFEMPPAVKSRERPAPRLPALKKAQMWKDEWEIMGFTCGIHPMAACRDELRRKGVRMSTAIMDCLNQTIRLAGVIAAERRTRTERGALMQFLTFDDEAGVFEVVLFPDVYKKTRFLLDGPGPYVVELDGPGPYVVEGRPESQHGAISIRAVLLEAL